MRTENKLEEQCRRIIQKMAILLLDASRCSRKAAQVAAEARSPTPRFKCHITSPHQESLNILVISKPFGKTRTNASTRCLNLKSDVFHPTDLT